MDRNRYIQKLDCMMKFAEHFQALSTCKRHPVGVVIAPADCSQVYSVGYNGPARGRPNDSCTGEVGKCGCAHAEVNALVKPSAVIWKPSLLISTVAPCWNCANAIVNSERIIGVLFAGSSRHEISTPRPTDLLKEVGIDVLSYDSIRIYSDDTLAKWWSACRVSR